MSCYRGMDVSDTHRRVYALHDLHAIRVRDRFGRALSEQQA